MWPIFMSYPNDEYRVFDVYPCSSIDGFDILVKTEILLIL